MVSARRALAVAALAVSITATSYGPVGDGGRYGAGGGAVCGTDGQCRAYAREVLRPWLAIPVPAEDGSWVTVGYYAPDDDAETITYG